jgi:hypothetical protein
LATPVFTVFHGTMIAGIIGAIGNNAEGIAGLNWSVRLMAIRYTGPADADPELSHQTYWSRYLAAWDYVIAMKKRGVNVRVASTSDIGVVDSLAVRDAIEVAGAEGILAVFAAGNQAVNQDLYSSFPPAFQLPAAINVAASTESDTLARDAIFSDERYSRHDGHTHRHELHGCNERALQRRQREFHECADQLRRPSHYRRRSARCHCRTCHHRDTAWSGDEHGFLPGAAAADHSPNQRERSRSIVADDERRDCAGNLRRLKAYLLGAGHAERNYSEWPK